MKRILVAVSILPFLAVLPVRAEMSFDLQAWPSLMFNSGSTDYTIEALSWGTTNGGADTVLIGIRSKLEFPIDAPLTGLDIEASSKPGAEKAWTISLGALLNVDDPDKMMEDHDWLFDPNGYESFKFSWTESRTKIDYLHLRLEATLALIRSPVVQVAAVAGFHYNRIEFDMIGYDGWQVGDDFQVIDVHGTQRALYYKAIYKLPQIGARMKVTPGWQTQMALQLTIGRLLASDLDDHLLRGKTAEASTSGWAFLGHVSGRLMLSEKGSTRPFISGRAGWVTQSASGHQTQRWYKDEEYEDPDTGEVRIVRAGTVISGIDYETTAQQLRIGLGVGIAF